MKIAACLWAINAHGSQNRLTILMKPFKLNHSWENIWRRNVNQNITYNSPSNILQDLLQFQSYSQKYYRSRRQFLKEILSINGLRIITLLWGRLLTITPLLVRGLSKLGIIRGAKEGGGGLYSSHHWPKSCAGCSASPNPKCRKIML